jgi:hypothetical protein
MAFSIEVQDASALDLEPLKALIEERVRIPCREETIEREARSWRLSQMLMPFLSISLAVGMGVVLASRPISSWTLIIAKTVLLSLPLTYVVYRFKVSAVRKELRERVSSPIDVLLGYYRERLGRYRADLISGDGWLATIKKGRPYDDTIPPGAVRAHVRLCERCDELIARLELLIEPCEERLDLLKSALRMWAKAPPELQAQAWEQSRLRAVSWIRSFDLFVPFGSRRSISRK